MTSSGKLPQFRAPPVVEVVSLVQFESQPALNVVGIGALWAKFKTDYPKVEQHSPLMPVMELLGARRPLNAGPTMELARDGETPRVFFVSSNEADLLQIQSDRFIRNWRRRLNPDVTYPRYRGHVRPKFAQDYRKFRQFMASKGVKSLPVNQCEISYVNDILPNDVWKTHAEAGTIFTCFNSRFCGRNEGEFESLNLSMASRMNDRKGNFVGRLHVIIQSAFRLDAKKAEIPIFRLTLTARGRPLDETDKGVADFFDLGRRTIVRTFDRLTTTEMHKAWGKY